MTKYQIDKIIFKYLDNKNYIILKSETDVYFVENGNDEYAQIRLKNDGTCHIYYVLIDEISHFFSMEYSYSKGVIGRWVGNTLQTEVTNTNSQASHRPQVVGNTLQTEVTNTASRLIVVVMMVGNTLQTEVTNTTIDHGNNRLWVGNTLQTEVTNTPMALVV